MVKRSESAVMRSRLSPKEALPAGAISVVLVPDQTSEPESPRGEPGRRTVVAIASGSLPAHDNTLYPLPRPHREERGQSWRYLVERRARASLPKGEKSDRHSRPGCTGHE